MVLADENLDANSISERTVIFDSFMNFMTDVLFGIPGDLIIKSAFPILSSVCPFSS